MGWLNKIILGGLGFTIGGPIGAIIGIIIANSIDGASKYFIGDDNFNTEGCASRKYSREQTTNDFRMAFLVLFAAVMKADGTIKRSELDVVKRFLAQNYDDETATEALHCLKQILEQHIDVIAVSRQCGENMNYSTRIHLIHLLFSIAAADGQIDDSEVKVIEQIGAGMFISFADLKSIEAMFKPREDNKKWAYDILEIQPNASQDEIKKAYRKMAMKYHPDKVATLGESAKKIATEKFRKVKEAYDTLLRGGSIN